MAEYVEKIMFGDKKIILIATAHVSKQSVELVKQVISEEQPDSVCIELDDNRYENIQNPTAWEKARIKRCLKMICRNKHYQESVLIVSINII